MYTDKIIEELEEIIDYADKIDELLYYLLLKVEQSDHTFLFLPYDQEVLWDSTANLDSIRETCKSYLQDLQVQKYDNEEIH